MLFSLTTNIGSNTQTADQNWEYHKKWYSTGFYVDAAPSDASFPFVGGMAFINLKTAVLMGKDQQGDYLTNDGIVAWAEEANQ